MFLISDTHYYDFVIGAGKLVASTKIDATNKMLAIKVRATTGSNHTIKILSIGNREHFLLSPCANRLLQVVPSLISKYFTKYLIIFKHFQVPGITLHGTVMWFPEQFIMAHLPAVAKVMDKKLVQTLASNRHAFLQSKAANTTSDTKQLHHQVI